MLAPEPVFVDTIASLNYLFGASERFDLDVRSFHSCFTFLFRPLPERVWRNGSASASQAEGCGFESRRPLQFLTDLDIDICCHLA